MSINSSTLVDCVAQPIPIEPGVEFRLHPSFPGYAFGSDGSVWSCLKKGTRSFGVLWRKLKQWKGGYKRQYLCVTIRSALSTKRANYEVHRLILQAYVGSCPEGMEGCHNNGNPADNRSVNLRWGTPKENTEDKRTHGTIAKGEKLPHAKLTMKVVQNARLAAKEGVALRKIAESAGVDVKTIRRAVIGETWKHVPMTTDR